MTADRKVRVLHVLGSLAGGGIQTFVLEVLRHYDRAQFQMDVCAMSEHPGRDAASAESLGSRVYTCSLRAHPLTFSNRLRGILQEGGYDIIHVNRSGSMSGVPLWVARQAHIPVRIAHYHSVLRTTEGASLRGLLGPALRALVLREATHIVGCSREVLQTHFGRGWGLDPRMHVIHNGIDVSRYADTSVRPWAREELGIPNDSRVVGTVGRLCTRKNHGLFVRIAKMVAAQVRDVWFLVVGDGPLRAHLMALVEQGGLDGRFVFAGWRYDIPRMLAAMDVFLFTSLWEGFGIALVEAQAAGVPCVVSDLPVFDEALAPEQQGNRFPVDSPERGAAIVVSMLKDPRRRQQQGEAGKVFAQRFDVKECVRNLQELYLTGVREGRQRGNGAASTNLRKGGREVRRDEC